MAARIVSTSLLVIIGLVLLAWPMSRIGLHSVEEAGGTRRIISLSDRALRFASEPLAARAPLERDRFTVATGPSLRIDGRTPAPTDAPWFIPRTGQGTGAARLILPLPLLLFAAVALLLPFPIAGIVRARRRRRCNQCLACGYSRPGHEGVCTECGLSAADAAAAARAYPALVLRDASIMMFIVLLAFAGWTWTIAEREERADAVHRANIVNYGWYRAVTQPHLLGSIIVAQAGDEPGNLAEVLSAALPGTVIVLAPGTHDLGDRFRLRGRPHTLSLSDVWIIGAGPDTTTLSLDIDAASRVRIEGVTIECNNTPFADLRRGGQIHIVNSRIQGYNSGAGGSNAIFGTDAVVLVEACEFEGLSGRASSSHRGRAFDLRGSSRLFVRDTAFIDNTDIVRNAAGILDGSSFTTTQPQFFAFAVGPNLHVRNSPLPPAAAGRPVQLTTFTEALDDLKVVERLGGPDARRASAWSDPIAFEAARGLAAWRSPRFWDDMQLHPSAKIREIARTRATTRPVQLPEITLNDALLALDERIVPSAATIAFLRSPAQARPALEKLAATGTERQQHNARAILMLMEVQPPLLDQLEHAARLTE